MLELRWVQDEPRALQLKSARNLHKVLSERLGVIVVTTHIVTQSLEHKPIAKYNVVKVLLSISR